MQITPKLIEEGYVSRTKHPKADLWVHNYTQKAQFEGRTGLWEQYPELLQCRGLILDGEGKVIAKPFSKFFNLEEYPDGVPSFKSFKVFDKLDGSLGIVYPLNGTAHVATRGSFTSEQAIWATKYLQENHKMFCDVFVTDKLYERGTWLFEIIYPENRIVVDYKGKQSLILLSIVNPVTGYDIEFDTVEWGATMYKFDCVEKFDGITDFKHLREIMKRDNAEGFVVQFDTGLRVKLKYEEYVRLHRIVTGVSTKTIWEMLRDNQSFEEVLECVPDEFHEWVERTRSDLLENYKFILDKAQLVHDFVQRFETRKDQAIYIKANAKELMPVIFTMLDSKDHAKVIWKMVRPKYKQPFQTRENI